MGVSNRWPSSISELISRMEMRLRAPVTRGYFFLLGALRLVNIDQKKISSGTQGMLNQEDSTGSVDQTQLDSASESEKKWANHKQFPSVFVSRAVQKVMLVGCDWWFSIRIFFIAEKPLPTTRTCTVVNFHNLLSLFGQFGSLSSDQCLFVVQNSFFGEIQRENLKISRRRKGTVIRET